jgi:hypothetical protein
MLDERRPAPAIRDASMQEEHLGPVPGDVVGQGSGAAAGGAHGTTLAGLPAERNPLPDVNRE